MAKPLIQRNICSQLVTGLTGFHFWIVFIIRTISLYQGSLDSSYITVAAVSKTRLPDRLTVVFISSILVFLM